MSEEMYVYSRATSLSVLFFSSRGWKEMREKRYDSMMNDTGYVMASQKKEIEEEIRGRREKAHTRQHTHTDTQKVEDDNDGGSLHECDTDGITSADHKEKQEFLYFTHSRNKKKKKEKEGLSVWFFVLLLLNFFPYVHGKRERERDSAVWDPSRPGYLIQFSQASSAHFESFQAERKAFKI